MSNYVELYQTPDCKLFGSLVCHVKGVHWGWKSNSTLELVDDQNWTIMISGCHEKLWAAHKRDPRSQMKSLSRADGAAWNICSPQVCTKAKHASFGSGWENVREYVYIYLIRTIFKKCQVEYSWISCNIISSYMINEFRHTGASTCCMQGVQVPLKRIKLHGVACPCACISWKKWGQHFEKEDTGLSSVASDWPGKIWKDYICNDYIMRPRVTSAQKQELCLYKRRTEARKWSLDVSFTWFCSTHCKSMTRHMQLESASFAVL